MAPFFDVVLISGDLGYRKPHAHVFRHLIDAFAVPKEHIAFIGDDLDADIRGAQQAGLQPIWTVYARMRKALETPGAMLPADPQPPPTVPTIASWRELLLLLDGASAPPDQGLVPTTQ
jgi:putative hydrolase of the HAD superfamily